MCGIFGVLNFNQSQLEISRSSLKTLEHRGRDQWGEWYDERIYLGHQRLSILDLSESGKQPFVTENSACIVNGEIYNYKELQKEIGEHKFKSNSDSEVILHGFELWGIDILLSKLDGMYAFAIYDFKNCKLFLSKDRWGKKPIS